MARTTYQVKGSVEVTEDNVGLCREVLDSQGARLLPGDTLCFDFELSTSLTPGEMFFLSEAIKGALPAPPRPGGA